MTIQNARPPFIVSAKDIPEEPGRYPGSDEVLGYGRALGKIAGLLRIGVHLERLPPGQRTSYPHAELGEEEFVYVVDGDVDAWIDGHLHPMTTGDFAAFPQGTGICHTFINNSARDVTLLVGGEASKRDNKVYYPLNPERKAQMPWSRWWDDAPVRPQGPHDGLPRPR